MYYVNLLWWKTVEKPSSPPRIEFSKMLRTLRVGTLTSRVAAPRLLDRLSSGRFRSVDHPATGAILESELAQLATKNDATLT
jgi:hypothetical protein